MDELSLSIVFQGLLDGIINADRIDSCDSRLHLKLGIVNSRFEIKKIPC